MRWNPTELLFFNSRSALAFCTPVSLRYCGLLLSLEAVLTTVQTWHVTMHRIIFHVETIRSVNRMVISFQSYEAETLQIIAQRFKSPARSVALLEAPTVSGSEMNRMMGTAAMKNRKRKSEQFLHMLPTSLTCTVQRRKCYMQVQWAMVKLLFLHHECFTVLSSNSTAFK